MPKTKRYEPNSGWLNVQLESDVDAKLREMKEKRRPKLTLTALVESAIEREWAAWKREDAKS
jgi:hypothetical protein